MVGHGGKSDGIIIRRLKFKDGLNPMAIIFF
jgi:hypothetical protein